VSVCVEAGRQCIREDVQPAVCTTLTLLPRGCLSNTQQQHRPRTICRPPSFFRFAFGSLTRPVFNWLIGRWPRGRNHLNDTTLDSMLADDSAHRTSVAGA